MLHCYIVSFKRIILSWSSLSKNIWMILSTPTNLHWALVRNCMNKDVESISLFWKLLLWSVFTNIFNILSHCYKIFLCAIIIVKRGFLLTFRSKNTFLNIYIYIYIYIERVNACDTHLHFNSKPFYECLVGTSIF